MVPCLVGLAHFKEHILKVDTWKIAIKIFKLISELFVLFFRVF